jgi:hypothetical protein
MIHELTPSQFGRVSYLFEGPKHHVPVIAILNRDFPGRVFVDDPDGPRVAVAWALTRWAYISGDPGTSSFIEMMPDLVDRIIIPDSRKMGQTWFELYCPNDSVWTARIESVLSAYHPGSHYELLLTLDPSRFHSSRVLQLPPGVRVERVQVPIIPQRARDCSLIEEGFRTRTAVGFACLLNNSQVAVCQSNGFAAGREFMVDVETPDPVYRGKGYARLASHALVEDSIRRGDCPLWETVEGNQASLHLAQGLGFIQQERYPVSAIEF